MAARVYELVLFFKPNVERTSARSISARLQSVLTASGASNIVCSLWNKVNLAYKVCGLDTVFGIHVSFKLHDFWRTFAIVQSVKRRLKPLRIRLFLSSEKNIKVLPSFLSRC
ncbi:hypothetical protein AADW59_00185 [Candidatus Hodgkinia cicadicola]